jgi:Haem-binding domain
MKVIALTILLLMLALIAVGSALSRKVTPATPGMRDYRYADPVRGTEGGKMLTRACGNCHSNQTKLPWYGHVVPISWWINRHVSEGRQALNFAEWTTYSARRQRDELESICGVVSNDRMPPASYRVLHPESRLEAEDKKLICAWAANEWEREK